MREGRSGYIARLLVCDSLAKVGNLILAPVDKTGGVVRGGAMQCLAHVHGSHVGDTVLRHDEDVRCSMLV